jgi:glycosyltransferase involved in cell wall biosynthesis
MAGSSLGRVGMVLETSFPPDARVEREALALIEAGYEVHLLCRNQNPTLPSEEIYKGIHITRVDPSAVAFQMSLPKTRFRIKARFPYRGLCRSLWKRLTGLENDWRYLIHKFVRENKIDILHVHDLKLLNTSLSVASDERTPKVVADLHENYPALVGSLTELRKGKAKGTKKRIWWANMERKTLRKVNRVIVVVEEAMDRILQDPTLRPDKISIVRNVVDNEKFLSSDVSNLSIENEALFMGRFVLCYVGHINARHRGIQTVLEAIPLITSRIPNFLFVGVGTLKKHYYQETLQPLVDRLNVDPYVYLTGYRDEACFAPYIKQSDICICPHLKTELTDTTFPNKVFLYSLFKKPVIVSSCLPLERYVKDTDSGLVYRSGDPEKLAEVILKLYEDPSLRKLLGTNGQQWVLNRFCWEKEKQNLLEAYQTL